MQSYLYLDTRRDEKLSRIRYAISLDRRVSYITLDFQTPPECWDEENKRIVWPKATADELERERLRLDGLLARISTRGRTAAQVRDELKRLAWPQSQVITFVNIYNRYRDSREASRTKEIYDATMKRIREYDGNADVLMCEDITLSWLNGFDEWLKKNSPSKNARNIHFRNIRAVINYAIDEEYTTAYPFRKFQIRREPTRKRALTLAELRTLFNADNLPQHLYKYIDLFKLSFYLIGMNTEDLVNIVDISAGRVDYARAKTHKAYSIKLEPEAAEIIARQRGKNHYLYWLDSYKNAHNANSKADKALHEAARLLGLPDGLSMYWARHSWATLAAELDIPKETIAAALGHSGNTVTDIYIRFDTKKIDEANRRVLDYVKNGQRPDTVEDMLKKIMAKI